MRFASWLRPLFLSAIVSVYIRSLCIFILASHCYSSAVENCAAAAAASKMMCEVMPTITEGDSGGGPPPRSAGGGGGGGGAQNGSEQEANFEQLMVNMLDERDKLLESLRESQETLIHSQGKLQGALHERDVLQRQINAALPQVSSASDPAEGGWVQIYGGPPYVSSGY